MSDSEDEGTPQLSSHALAALQEFYAEQKQRADSGGHDKYDLGVIEENWQLSQFWYNQETALRLAEEAVAAAGDGGRDALAPCARPAQSSGSHWAGARPAQKRM